MTLYSNEYLHSEFRLNEVRAYTDDMLQRYYDTINNALNSRSEFLVLLKRYRERTGVTPAQVSAKKFRATITTDRWYAEQVLKERGLL